MRAVVIGGGPGGLFLARLLALTEPRADVRVYERNDPHSDSGFGLVFSGSAMDSLRAADQETWELVRAAGVRWTDFELRTPNGVVRYGGHDFTALPRQELLRILHEQARRAAVRLHFRQQATASDMTADVVVIADGSRSRHRDALAAEFGSRISAGRSKYIWFCTSAPFDAMTFPFVTTEYGTFGAHAHPYGEGVSSFIVETDEVTWTAAGSLVSTPERARRWLSEVFAEHLGGRPLMSNGSGWSNFRVVQNERWSHGNTVLLGDAAHTAHYSVGSGTAMAMKDAIALTAALQGAQSVTSAFAEYERRRRSSVVRLQELAGRSMRWWETFGRRVHLPAQRFGAHYLTRTGTLPLRAVGGADPMAAEFDLGPVRLRNRLIARAGVSVDAGVVLAAGRENRREASVAAEESGAVFGAEAESPAAALDAYAFGARVIELPCTALPLGDLPVLPGDAALVAGVTCPPGQAWSDDGDDLVRFSHELRRSGVAAVHLRGSSAWHHLLDHADRIQSEAALPVIVAAPAEEHWEQARVAMATGRVDLLAMYAPSPFTERKSQAHV